LLFIALTAAIRHLLSTFIASAVTAGLQAKGMCLMNEYSVVKELEKTTELAHSMG
jgi:hypothetical protein